jgi:phage shock protein E
MKKLLVLLGAMTLTVYCERKSDTAKAPANMSPGQSELKALLDGKATVVDVRTPAEFAAGHHPRAKNIPVDELESRLAEFGDKSKPVVVYCASGNRSGRAKQILEAAGFQNVVNAGGYRDLP